MEENIKVTDDEGDGDDHADDAYATTTSQSDLHPHEENKTIPKNKNPALHIIGPAYARNKTFWISILFSTIPQGLFMALIALAFFVAFDGLNKATWLTDEYELALVATPPPSGGTSSDGSDDMDILRVGKGQWWYVGLLSGAGGCVGLVKVLWTFVLAPNHPFPDKPPGLVQELAELRAHDALICIPVIVCSAIGIGLGASTGPEAALGCFGTSLGSGFVAHGRKHWKTMMRFGRCKRREEEEMSSESSTTVPEEEDVGALASYVFPDLTKDEQLCALDGIAGAFGALFPTQFLSPMMLHEIGFLWGPDGSRTTYHFMETVVRTGIASSVGYALFVGLKQRTFLEQATLPEAAYDLLPTIQLVSMFHAFLLGILCGGVGLLGILFLGIGKVLGGKCQTAINAFGSKMGLPDRFLGMLLTPVVGGTFLGLIAKACPLTLGDGSHQLQFIILNGTNLGAGDLAANMFAKLACVSIALGFGFVGGQIFPLLFSGACLGTLCHVLVPDLSLIVSVTSCMCAVPSAFLPALFTFTTLISMVIALGGAGTTPIFVAGITSYTTVCGFGILQDIMAKAAGDGGEKQPAASSDGGGPTTTTTTDHHLNVVKKQEDREDMALPEGHGKTVMGEA